MSKSYDYDLVVIGAGIAGMVAAVTANGMGKRTAVVEKMKVGGNCTNYTCIPSKALIHLSSVGREMTHLEHQGILKQSRPHFNGPGVLSHIRSVVQRAYDKDTPDSFEHIGIRMIKGKASFLDPHRIDVNGDTISAGRFILAAGTRPFVPAIKGIQDVSYLTNENLYELEELPGSIVILGGGVDGLEYASALGRLGVETTAIEMASRLLPMADLELVNELERALSADGIRILKGTRAVAVREENGHVVVTCADGADRSEEVRADRILVAVGRTPDLEGLNLESAGVKYSPKGIMTDEKLVTSTPHILACGDVAGPFQLACTAEHQGIVAAVNAFSPLRQKVDYRNMVNIIFTLPPLASIGMSEQEAHDMHGDNAKVYRFEYTGMRRAMIDGAETGLAKFICDRRGRLIGAHILGEAAPEVIHEAQVIKALKKPLHKLNEVTHGYPTYAQALVGRAAQLAFLDRMKSSIFVRLGFALMPGFENRLGLARDRLAEKEPSFSTGGTRRVHLTLRSETPDSEAFTLSADHASGAACIIDLPESLECHDETPYRWICSDATVGGPSGSAPSVLNFSRVRRMNGFGAVMLYKLWVAAMRKGLPVRAYGVSGSLRTILATTELDQVIQIHATRRDAMNAAGLFADHAPSSAEPEPLENRHNWMQPVQSLTVSNAPKEARNINVDGLSVVTPVNGFGLLWQKTFRLHIEADRVTPEETIEALKQNFPAFQPSFNRFYPVGSGIVPGEVVLIESSTPGGPVATGVVVIYADERSFTFGTPQGHPEAGWVSFAAHYTDNGTAVEILGFARAGDPVYEAAFRLAGSSIQTRIWTHVLSSLAAHLGVPAHITTEAHCVDARPQWSRARNVWHNAQIRTLIHEPRRLLGR
jgi:pyruvate/2-oxoglutarate dehydrogenase complex dihydrolipoamide dehydrogenase (E3) component